MRSRYDIYLTNYAKVLHIEAHTMVSMTQKDIIPAVIRYGKELADSLLAKKEAGLRLACTTEKELLTKVSSLTDRLSANLDTLRAYLAEAEKPGYAPQDLANYYRDKVIPAMAAVREDADSLEVLVAKDLWPLPSYGDILFSVR